MATPKPDGPTASMWRVLSRLQIGEVYSYTDLARMLLEVNPTLVSSNVSRTIKIAVRAEALVREAPGAYKFVGPCKAFPLPGMEAYADQGPVVPLKTWKPDPMAEVLASLAELHNRLDAIEARLATKAS